MDLGNVTPASPTTDWAAITGGVYTMSINGDGPAASHERFAVILEYRENSDDDAKTAGDAIIHDPEQIVNVQLGAGEVRARLSGDDAAIDFEVRLADGA